MRRINGKALPRRGNSAADRRVGRARRRRPAPTERSDARKLQKLREADRVVAAAHCVHGATTTDNAAHAHRPGRPSRRRRAAPDLRSSCGCCGTNCSCAVPRRWSAAPAQHRAEERAAGRASSRSILRATASSHPLMAVAAGSLALRRVVALRLMIDEGRARSTRTSSQNGCRSERERSRHADVENPASSTSIKRVDASSVKGERRSC